MTSQTSPRLLQRPPSAELDTAANPAATPEARQPTTTTRAVVPSAFPFNSSSRLGASG